MSDDPAGSGMHRGGRYRPAAIVGLVGAMCSIAAGFMTRLSLAGRTFKLAPGVPGPGYVQRLAVNVLFHLVMPLVMLVAGIMLLRERSQKERWSGAVLGAGALFGLSAASQLLAKPFTGAVWFAGAWLETLGYLIMFVAALLVVWTWLRTRTPRVATPEEPIPAIPDPPRP